MHILLTGGAGFIGSHVAEKLLQEGHQLTVIDNFDSFYDKDIKEKNLSSFIDKVTFYDWDLADSAIIQQLENVPKIDLILHLAAKAGVRPSIQNPSSYIRANVDATLNLLEFARKNGVKRTVFASSSSVYGINQKVPFAESDAINQSISPYAASKIACEQLAHSFSHIYGLSITALRFFTVYGPRQRPDLAIHKFARMILNDQPIPVYGDGSTARDYTYIDDIVQGVLGAVYADHQGFDVYNLGESKVIPLKTLIRELEHALGKKATIDWQPMQAGDVPFTYADISKARAFLGYDPQVDLKTGLKHFVEWLKTN
ncbi:NAD-dependent epimerase/dehydratase family protein [bacterium]|nr:MAG: NAD-dependent epimerase/dehydratase family protein [bacterium]